MANFFNNFFLKRVYKGPSTHFIKPKSFNIRFKGNVLPNYTYLNLEPILSASPEMSKNEKGQFEVKLNLTFLDKTNQVMVIGLFNDEDLARQAYARTINAFFSPNLSIFKFFLTLTIVIVALQFTTGFIFNMGNIIAKRNAALSVNNQQERLKQNEMEKMSQLLRQQSQSNTGVSDIRNPNLVSQPNLPSPSISQLVQQNHNSFEQVNKSLDSEIAAIQESQNNKSQTNPLNEKPTAADILLEKLNK